MAYIIDVSKAQRGNIQYGQKEWHSPDWMFTEGKLRSYARDYRDVPEGKEEFVSFCRNMAHAPNDVIERAWKRVNG